jgi:hypothetical protein
LPGDTSETRASATGCPGVAASPSCLLSFCSFGAGHRARNKGRWPPQRLRLCHRRMMNGQLALATVAVLVRKSAGVAGLKRSFRRQAVTRQKQESTNDAVGWLARPHLFCPEQFRHGFARISTDQTQPSFSSCPFSLSLLRGLVAGILCSGLVFAGLPQNRCGASQLLHN